MSQCTYCKGLTSTPRCQISSCKGHHCISAEKTPPLASFLHAHFPKIDIDYRLDRNNRRCKKCDLVDTYKKLQAAELLENGKGTKMSLLKRRIEALQTECGMATGEKKAELEEGLTLLMRQQAETIKGVDREANEAWKWYYGIWGLKEVKIEK